ncbi:MAG: C40 family peptidase [Gallionellaceae bacterium]
MKKILIITFVLFLSGCSSTLKRGGSASSPSDEKTNDLLLYAMSLADTPYRYGGSNTEDGFDCSGFVGHVYKQTLNISLPRTSAEISREGKAISNNEVQPGDLVFFNTRHRAYSHVGIYVGEGKFIHAPKTGSRIKVDNMKDYWLSRYSGARRIY